MRSRSEAVSGLRDEKLREWEIDVPNDPINEQVVLAAMIVNDDVRRDLVARLPPDAFFANEHRVIVAGLAELVRKGLAYDPATLVRLAPEANIRILEQLVSGRPDVPPNLDYHVELLLWDWKRAQFVQGPLAAIIEAIQNPKEKRARITALRRQIGEFDVGDSPAPFLRDSKQVVHEMMQTIDRRIAGEAHYPFGIKGLDFDENGVRRMRPGAAPGLTTLLTGMSGAGKTTFAAKAILGLTRLGRRVGVGAWEVRAPMTLELITTLSLKWSRSRMLDARNQVDPSLAMTKDERDEFMARAEMIAPWITFIENPFRRGSVRAVGKITNDDHLDILEQHVDASGCEVFVFDLFDRCLRDRRPDQEQEALWRVLEWTDRLQVHSIIVHQQLIKGDDVRADKKPSLAGMKGSSAYVDAGANVIAPHIPARFKDVPDNKFEVYGLKARFGPPFAVEFDWTPDTGQFGDSRSMSLHEAVWGDDEHKASKTGAAPRKQRGKK